MYIRERERSDDQAGREEEMFRDATRVVNSTEYVTQRSAGLHALLFADVLDNGIIAVTDVGQLWQAHSRTRLSQQGDLEKCAASPTEVNEMKAWVGDASFVRDKSPGRNYAPLSSTSAAVPRD